MHTVLSAYKQGRDDGVIEMRQGRGAFVRQDAGNALISLTELVEQLVEDARKLGVPQPDIVQIIRGVAKA